MSTAFELSLKPLKPSELPPISAITTAARQLLSSTPTWTPGKSYGSDGSVVQTFWKKSTDGGPAWHCRVSTHGAEVGSFDRFWEYLGVDKALHEKEYHPTVSKVTLLQTLVPGTSEIWSMHYNLPSPFSPRTFTTLFTTFQDLTVPERREGWMVRMPIDWDEGDSEGKDVKGRTVSVERILELENGKVEWRVATCSTPGGNIPQFVSERALPGQICQDVPYFIDWLKNQPAAVHSP